MKLPINALLLFIFLLSGKLYAQFELKTSPQLWLVKTVNISLEYGINPNIGIEAEYQRLLNNTRSIFASTANGGYLALKYYFVKNKKTALSNFYTGGYTTYMTGL
jgi:hypothetical protein